MRDESARLGVETTMRRDRIVRSATESRSNWLIDQWHSARPDRNALEKTWLGGPRMGSSSINIVGINGDGPEVGLDPRTNGVAHPSVVHSERPDPYAVMAI